MLFERRIIDTGERFGRLTIIKEVERKHNRRFLCQCDCGSVIEVDMSHLAAKHTKSCGCWRIDRATRHGGYLSRLYSIWENMIARCSNKNSPNYEYYGGRGIQICDEWKEDFSVFREWGISNGYADKLELDRIDNNANYSPSNCRWVPHSVNQRNKYNNVFVTAFGETKLLVEWAEDSRCKVAVKTLRFRIRVHGWLPEEAITFPLHTRTHTKRK
jgi:hypothetical protein